MTQKVKNPPALQEIWVLPLGWEDSLEEIMATHSSILAWRTPWTEDLVGYSPRGHERVRHGLATKQQQTKKSDEQDVWLWGSNREE